MRESGRAEFSSLMERILYEVKKVVVGQDHFLERVLVAMLATLGRQRGSNAPAMLRGMAWASLAFTLFAGPKQLEFAVNFPLEWLWLRPKRVAVASLLEKRVAELEARCLRKAALLYEALERHPSVYSVLVAPSPT